MIAPLVTGLAVFYLWPVFQTGYYSFTTWGPFGGSEFTGLANYVALFEDDELLRAVKNTLVYSAIVVAGIPLAIVVAALLNQRNLRGVGVYRALYFLPVVTMPAAIAMVWKWLYNGDHGLINHVLSFVGIPGQNWASDSRFALYAIAVIAVWMTVGYNMVIFLAGLQAIPKELYEAAEIDGASKIRQFRSITLPLLTPSIFFVAVLTVIASLQAFDVLYMILGPTNPATVESRTIVYLFYEKAFMENDKGAAAAMACVLLVFMMAITAVQFRLQKRWVHYV
ncbi:MAG TPA: sugar ABC transporter permease [Actinokineospora sp.]|nr:sugar ABC transporter permease [Actinokineospora sp.]